MKWTCERIFGGILDMKVTQKHGLGLVNGGHNSLLQLGKADKMTIWVIADDARGPTCPIRGPGQLVSVWLGIETWADQQVGRNGETKRAVVFEALGFSHFWTNMIRRIHWEKPIRLLRIIFMAVDIWYIAVWIFCFRHWPITYKPHKGDVDTVCMICFVAHRDNFLPLLTKKTPSISLSQKKLSFKILKLYLLVCVENYIYIYIYIVT